MFNFKISLATFIVLMLSMGDALARSYYGRGYSGRGATCFGSMGTITLGLFFVVLLALLLLKVINSRKFYILSLVGIVLKQLSTLICYTILLDTKSIMIVVLLLISVYVVVPMLTKDWNPSTNKENLNANDHEAPTPTPPPTPEPENLNMNGPEPSLPIVDAEPETDQFILEPQSSIEKVITAIVFIIVGIIALLFFVFKHSSIY